MGRAVRDEVIPLAFALQRNPGAYALLVGAGMSVGAGLPSAWDVRQALLQQLAAVEGETPEDLEAWYVSRFGEAASYHNLFSRLGTSQVERQQLLKQFFDPATSAEQKQLADASSSAHSALARLVKEGRLRIIITTNFDRLIEHALVEAGVEPVVVADPAMIVSLPPLHAHECLVVHLHGDYLHPSAMLNTGSELREYSAELTQHVLKVATEYGLIFVGWSARTDEALRQLLTDVSRPFYPSYWIDPAELPAEAAQVQAKFSSTLIRADASVALTALADACEAIDASQAHQPMSIEMEVRQAKKALASTSVAISLHDRIRAELDHLRSIEPLTTEQMQPLDPNVEYQRRLHIIQEALKIPMALVAATAYWGDESTDRWWFNEIEALTRRRTLSGTTAFIHLRQLPATALVYAAGCAALASERLDLAARLITEPQANDPYAGPHPVRRLLDVWPPNRVLEVRNPSRVLQDMVVPMLGDQVGTGQRAADSAWETFEYLRVLQAAFDSLQKRGEIVDLVRARAKTLGDPQDPKLPTAKQEYSALLERHRGAVSVHSLQVRVRGQHPGYVTQAAAWLEDEMYRHGDESGLMRGRLCAANVDASLAVADLVNVAISEFASHQAWSVVRPGGGVVPDGPFWLTEPGLTPEDL